jgi:hypothetical protein
MNRFVLAIALACALAGSAFAGEVHTPGAPEPGEIHTPGAPEPGETHGPGAPEPGDGHTPGWSFLLNLIDLAF